MKRYRLLMMPNLPLKGYKPKNCQKLEVMQNIRQLLNRDNWLDYLRMAREGGLTDGAIANDIVAKIDKALRADNNHKSKPKIRSDESKRMAF